ncbi:unnamed protein product, partial [Ectocarpus sp. 8 AP-2014]
ITVPTGCCPGCGSKFQSEDPASPGFLQLDKLDGVLGNDGGASTVMTAEGTREAAAVTTDEADMDPEAWLEAQSDINTDLDFDLDLGDEDDDGGEPRGEWVEGSYASPAGVPTGGGGGLGRASRDTAVLAGRTPTTTAAAAAAAAGATELSSKEAVAGWGLPETGMATLEEEGEEEQEKLLVCQRCYRLRNYGSVEDTLRPGFSDSDLLTPQRFLELLGSIRKQRCLIIYLVDLFDFHGTFLYNLPKITGRRARRSILPSLTRILASVVQRSTTTKRNAAPQWVRDKCRESGLPDMEMRDVHLVSCKHGVGIPPLMRKGGGRGGKAPAVAGRGVTVSSVPGTTLDFLKARSCHKRALYDTPGLLLPHTLTSRLNAEELRAAIPKKKVDHVTFRVGEGKVVLVGGLARVEVVTGRPFLLTFFVSNDVRLHPTDASR